MANPAVTQTPTTATAPDAAARQRRPASRAAALLSSPFLVATVACLVLAAISAALLPTVPSYDPWAWIVWGREVVDPHLSFSTGGGPSWKPLPVMFTTVYGLAGGASPTLWVITARAGGLLGLVAAYRLGVRVVTGTPLRRSGIATFALDRRWAAPAAGLIAAAAVLLTQDWFYYMFRGTSEPMLIATALWAVDRHLAARPGSAFAFGVAASLIRPEAWPFIAVYAIWLWLRRPRLRMLIIIGLVAIPFFWFVPPWIGSGQPFLAASHAKAYNGHLGAHPLLEVLRRGADLQTVPVLIAAVLGVGVSWFWYRDRLALALAGCAVGWWVLVVAMTLDGYPGLERFYLPAAGLTCVLAGVGVVRIAELIASVAGSRAGPSGAQVGAMVASVVALAMIALVVALGTDRVNIARAQESVARRAVTRLNQLSLAVAAAGGHRRVFPCRSSFAAVNHAVQTALAWKLHVTLGRVGTSLRHQGVLFVGPHDTIDGQPAPVNRRLTRSQLVVQSGVWRIYRVTHPGSSVRCVGT